MIRKIIKIDEEKCNGCGLCAKACHEGAIDIVDHKAKLVRENYCDGLGDCLPNCPQNAISFVYREAPAYDEAAVLKSKMQKTEMVKTISQITNWPVQLKLAPIVSSCYQREFLIAADCCAYAYGNFHQDFIKGKTVLIGCTKLDNVDYSEKLSAIIATNPIEKITVVKMEVPCCNGMKVAVNKAIEYSGKTIDLEVVTISTEGEILD